MDRGKKLFRFLRNPYSQKDRGIMPLLFLVILLFFITICAAGWILGRGKQKNAPGRINTIKIAPENKTDTVHFSGKVLQSSGKPYSQKTVELHSSPRSTKTDEYGNFVFTSASFGDHDFCVYGRSGKELIKRRIRISRIGSKGKLRISMRQDGRYEIVLSDNIKWFEIKINLDQDKKELSLDTDKISYLTDEGTVVTPGGTADIKDGIIVTPNGNVITSDGSVVCGSGDNQNNKVIIPSGKIKKDKEGSVTLPDGTTVDSNGVVRHGGTVIEKDGKGTTVNGERRTPGENGYQVTSGDQIQKLQPIGGEGTSSQEHKTPAQADHSSPRPGTATPNSTAGTNKTEGSGSDKNSHTGGTSGSPGRKTTAAPSQTTTATGPAATTAVSSAEPTTGTVQTTATEQTTAVTEEGEYPDQGISMEHGTASFGLAQWQQDELVPLFSNLSGGVQKAGTIAPGTEGYYYFRIVNDNDYDIEYSLKVTEGQMHLPMQFAVAEEDGSLRTEWVEAGLLESVETQKLVLKKKQSRTYQIRWKWPYHTTDSNDKWDTNGGMDSRGSYTVNIVIRTEQIK